MDPGFEDYWTEREWGFFAICLGESVILFQWTGFTGTQLKEGFATCKGARVADCKGMCD